MSARTCLSLAAALGFLAVLLGAFGAHGLSDSGYLERSYSDLEPKNVSGMQDTLLGMEDGVIRDITFDNVTIGGEKITNLRHFRHNEHVRDIEFK